MLVYLRWFFLWLWFYSMPSGVNEDIRVTSNVTQITHCIILTEAWTMMYRKNRTRGQKYLCSNVWERLKQIVWDPQWSSLLPGTLLIPGLKFPGPYTPQCSLVDYSLCPFITRIQCDSKNIDTLLEHCLSDLDHLFHLLWAFTSVIFTVVHN